MPGFQKHIKLAVRPISHREICERYRAKKMPVTQTHTYKSSQLKYSEFGLHYELLKEHEKEELKTEARNYQLITHKEAIDPQGERLSKKKQLSHNSSLGLTGYKQCCQ